MVCLLDISSVRTVSKTGAANQKIKGAGGAWAPRLSSWPGASLGYPRSGAGCASAPSGHHIRIDDIRWRAGGIGHNLVEYIRELDFVFVARDVAEMWRADHIIHGQQGIVDVAQRFLFIDIDRRHAGPAGAQRIDQRVGLD